MRTTRIALVAAVLGIAACGGDDTPTAASCTKSWNADANATQQATLAGVGATDILVGDRYRIGTWPKGEQKVSVTDGFGDTDTGHAAVVGKNACVILLPDSTLGQMAFVETDGKWGLVRGDEDRRGAEKTWADAALKSVAGAKDVEPDALGKLKLAS